MNPGLILIMCLLTITFEVDMSGGCTGGGGASRGHHVLTDLASGGAAKSQGSPKKGWPKPCHLGAAYCGNEKCCEGFTCRDDWCHPS